MKRRVVINTLGADGSGLGRDEEGGVWRVPGAFPDEVALVEGCPSRGVATAEKYTLETKSAQRVPSYCAVARCGGCALRELGADAAAQAKQRMVQEALHRIGGIEAAVSPIVTGPALGYRHRARLHGNGRALGYHAHGSRQIVPFSGCPVLVPRFSQRLGYLVQALGGFEGELEAVFQPDGDRLVVEAVGEAALAQPVSRGLCEGALVMGKVTRRYGEPHVLLRHPSFADGAPRFFLEPGVFSQANLALNAELVRLVAARVEPSAKVLELHAGAGNLTVGLRAAHVVATEWDAQAVMCLRRNVESHGCTVEVAELDDVSAWRKYGGDCDTVVLDPPRTGAKTLAAAIASAPGNLGRIVYVSCDPPSFARDAKMLASGFSVREVVPIDMFPGTPHVELVAVIERSA